MTQTQRAVLKGTDHTSVARQALETLFRTEGGRQGIWSVGGDPWVWTGGRWTIRPRAELEKSVIEWVEDALIPDGVDSEENATYKGATSELSGRDVREVIWLIERMAQAPVQSVPRWLEPGSWPDPDHCIAFDDRIVDIAGTAAKRKEGDEGVWCVVPRDDRFFGPAVLTVPFAPEAKSECWDGCQQQWSNGDGVWQDVRERAYGYALMGTRKYGKALLEYGKSQSGKGSGTNGVLSKLLLTPSYYSATIDQVVGGFGLDGLHQASVWVVPEVRDMDKGDGAKFATILKVVLGGDASSVNIKHIRQLRGVRFKVFPMMQANSMPNMPDDAGAVSSKLIVLPFKNSFADRRDEELPAKLGKELTGIAARFAEAAVRLEMAEQGKKWPIVAGAAEVLQQMALDGNPFDAFLKWAFVRSETAQPVGLDYILTRRMDFEAQTGVKLVRKDGRRVSDGQLLYYLELGSSWKVGRITMTDGRTALRGIGLKAIV